MQPHEFKAIIAEALVEQLQGSPTAGAAAINPNDVPDQSATQAAKYLRCSPSHLVTLVAKYPEHLKPITEEGKAVRYKFAQLHYLKSNNLVK